MLVFGRLSLTKVLDPLLSSDEEDEDQLNSAGSLPPKEIRLVMSHLSEERKALNPDQRAGKNITQTNRYEKCFHIG